MAAEITSLVPFLAITEATIVVLQISYPSPDRTGRKQTDYDQRGGISAKPSGGRKRINNDERSRGSCTVHGFQFQPRAGSFSDSISVHLGSHQPIGGALSCRTTRREQADDQRSDRESVESNGSRERIHNDERSRGCYTSFSLNQGTIDDGSFSDSFSDHHRSGDQLSSSGNSSCETNRLPSTWCMFCPLLP